MPIKDLFKSSEHSNNAAYFSAIVTIALSDGEINEKEEASLLRFADKLDISESEYEYILKHPDVYVIQPCNSREGRLHL